MPDGGFGQCEQGFCWVTPLPLGGKWTSTTVESVSPFIFYTATSDAVYRWVNEQPVLFSRGGGALKDLSWTNNRLYGVEQSDIIHYVGATPTPLTGTSAAQQSATEGSVYVFGCSDSSCSRVQDSSAMTVPTGPQTSRRVASEGPTALTLGFDATRSECVVERFNGLTYSPIAGPDGGLGSASCLIAANGPNEALLAGAPGPMHFFDGGAWSSVPYPLVTLTSLDAIWPAGAGRFWAAATGTLYRFENGTWSAGGVLTVKDFEAKGGQGVAVGTHQVTRLENTAPRALNTRSLPSGFTGRAGAIGEELFIGVSSSSTLYSSTVWRCLYTRCVNAAMPAASDFRMVRPGLLLAWAGGDPGTSKPLRIYLSDGGATLPLGQDFDGGRSTVHTVVAGPSGEIYAKIVTFGPSRIMQLAGDTWIDLLAPPLSTHRAGLTVLHGQLHAAPRSGGGMMRFEPDGGWPNATPASWVAGEVLLEGWSDGTENFLLSTMGIYRELSNGSWVSEFWRPSSSQGQLVGETLDELYFIDSDAGLLRRADAGTWASVPLPASFRPVSGCPTEQGGLYLSDDSSGVVYRP